MEKSIPDVVPVRWNTELGTAWVLVHADVVQGIGTTQPAAHTKATGRSVHELRRGRERSDVFPVAPEKPLYLFYIFSFP